MPSKTFLNLPKEKKVKFIKASLVEFSNHTLKDASINRIVKSCDIARGSFYQYFKDINDLYNYIFEVSYEKLEETFIKNIKVTKDIRKTFIKYFDTLIEYGSKKSNIKYFENIFRNMTLISIKENFLKNKKENIGIIISNIDKNQINKVGKDSFLSIIELLYITTYSFASEIFIYKQNKNSIREKYIDRINIITSIMY